MLHATEKIFGIEFVGCWASRGCDGLVIGWDPLHCSFWFGVRYRSRHGCTGQRQYGDASDPRLVTLRPS